MPRPLQTVNTSWAETCLAWRQQTLAPKTFARGDWQMSRAMFAEWLSKLTREPISASKYTRWEQGVTIPQKDLQNAVHSAVDKNLHTVKGK